MASGCQEWSPRRLRSGEPGQTWAQGRLWLVTQILLVLSLVDFYAVSTQWVFEFPGLTRICRVLWAACGSALSRERMRSQQGLCPACPMPWHTGPDISAFRSQTPACHLSIFSGHPAMSITTSSRKDPCPRVRPRPGISSLQLPRRGSTDMSRTISAPPFSHSESGENKRLVTSTHTTNSPRAHTVCQTCFEVLGTPWRASQSPCPLELTFSG